MSIKSNLRFRLITILYNSFKSDEANRPASSFTKGLNPAGKTGNTVIIIHSGLLPEEIKSCNNFNLFTIFFLIVSDLVFSNSFCKISCSFTKSIFFNISNKASPPVLATNSSSSNSLCNSSNCSIDIT